jgi:hypothetical protein
MLTVDPLARIRETRCDGRTIRQIADQLGHSTKTFIKALADPEPPPDALCEPRPAPVFGPFCSVVDVILRADETAPRKQRHTAAQVFRRLRYICAFEGRKARAPSLAMLHPSLLVHYRA